MRVLVVTQWFPPEPRELYLELAQAFQRLGHHVDVVTGFPNWPGGRVYPGYKVRLLHREVVSGVRTVRLPLFPNHSAGGLGRVLNLVSLAASLLVLGPFVLRRADHIHVVQNPFLVFAAKWLALLWRAKVSMEVQDLWPDTFKATGAVSSPIALRAVSRICSSAYRVCSKIRVISPGFKKELIARGVSEAKLEVIANWIDDESHKPIIKSNSFEGPTLPDGFRFLYAGSIGIPQNLSVVIEAAAMLSDRADIQFLFAGDGVEKAELELQVRSQRLKNVHFLGRFNQSKMGELYAQCDALFIHLAPDPLFSITIPSKIVSYMAYQKPILAAVEGDARHVIEASGAGVVVRPGAPVAFAEAARHFVGLSAEARSSMAMNGRHAAEEDFSFRRAVPKLSELLEAPK